MALTLAALRNCLEGGVPAVLATCAPDGTPNVAMLSQVHYVDDAHVALSFQFFNKTRANVLANPRATVLVVDPDSAAQYRLALEYLRTETEGPLFESMKAKLAGIASHTGMSKVFRLRGSDVYRVNGIEAVPGTTLPAPAARRALLPALRGFTRRLAPRGELAPLLDQVLRDLEELFGVRYSMMLLLDEAGRRLYTVASRGYDRSGVGSEIALGEGIIGVAAEQRTPIRVMHPAQEYAYSHALRRELAGNDPHNALEIEIPLPGLAEPHSQLAVPILLGARLLGVLYAESPEDMRFCYEDEDALTTAMSQVALALALCEARQDEPADPPRPAPVPPAPAGRVLSIERFAANDSVFIDKDYLIKGVAGAIFWKLMCEYTSRGRSEFSNRELRLDPSLRLPDLSDNLEARLILLQRRLEERCPFLRIEKTGRGRFRLQVDRPVDLIETPARPPA